MNLLEASVLFIALMGALLITLATQPVYSSSVFPGKELRQVQKKDFKIVIYAATWCGACHETMELLDSKGIKYTVYYIDKDKERRAEMYEKTGLPTIPQVFVDGKYVGGSSAVRVLVTTGAFD